jgi:hypothetical protein
VIVTVRIVKNYYVKIAMQWILARVVMLSFASTVQISKHALYVTMSRAESAQVLDIALDAKNTFVTTVSKKTAVFTAKKISVHLARTDF